MFRKILNFCLNEPARSAAGRITDGARKTSGVSSPCLLDCLFCNHSRTQSPSYARCDEGLWTNPYSELASDWLVLTPDIVFLPCFCGIRLWIWPEPLVAPRVRRALGTRMFCNLFPCNLETRACNPLRRLAEALGNTSESLIGCFSSANYYSNCEPYLVIQISNII